VQVRPHFSEWGLLAVPAASNGSGRRCASDDGLVGTDAAFGSDGVVSGWMTDRILVLRKGDPLSLVADACAALADAVNEPHSWSSAHDDLVAAYAAMVRAYAGLVRPTITEEVRRRVIDHVLDRLGQAERGEIVTSVVDIVNRLHGELVSQPVPG